MLVKARSNDAVKAAFAAAAGLREAGYVAELDLDGQKPASRWALEVGTGSLVLSES